MHNTLTDKNKQIRITGEKNGLMYLKNHLAEREIARKEKEVSLQERAKKMNTSLNKIKEINPENFLNTSESSEVVLLKEEISSLEKETNEDSLLRLILHSLERNERGDAELFIHTHKDKYVFDSSEGKSGEFYFWNGVCWQLDHNKQRYRDMEKVSELYEWAASKVPDEKIKHSFLARASSLRTSKRCSSVFIFVGSEIPFKGEWDFCPGHLPCLNGLVNLKTGSISSHVPEKYIRMVCPTEYIPNAKSDLFERFIDDITLGRKELKDFLVRCFGAALLGDAKEEKVFFLYGEKGRNGKGTLLQAIERVLGKIARTFPSEMLLQQRNPPSSSSPSPELANLQGVRFAIFSEINKGRKIDAAKVKNLSGRDTIPCRRLYSNIDLGIKPSHTMFIQTNYKPEAPSDDQALWARNYLIPFDAHFVSEPRENYERLLDPEFKEKLFKESESILAWLVNGCLQYQKEGLATPDIVRRETENYRKENDGIGLFLDEMCIKDKIFTTPKIKMEKAIKEFCDANGCKVPTRNEISYYLKTRFNDEKNERGRFWKGIKIVDEREFQQ